MPRFDGSMAGGFLGAAAILALFSGGVRAETMPSEYSTAVAAAEAAGRELDAAVRSPAPSDASEVAAARRKITGFCDSNYTSVTVRHGTKSSIYFIRRSDQAGELVIGRHYRVTGDEVAPSSTGCLVMPAPPSNAVGFAVTHLLSPTPTEFHVFLSLQQDRPLLVMTQAAAWSVDHGSIRYVKATSEGKSAAPVGSIDHPWRATEADQAAIDRALAPVLLQARQTYRGARSRFLAGLPPGYKFFVVTRLKDASGRFEQVFVRVDHYQGKKVIGRIANALKLLTNHRQGDTVTVAGEDVLDWVIVDPQGHEEGNVVGKFMDTYRPPS